MQTQKTAQTKRQPTLRAVNITPDPVSFEIAIDGTFSNQHRVEGGGYVDLPEGYVRRLRAHDKAEERPSVIENLTNGKVVPETDPRAAAILNKASKK
jgi:hypothetical protein